MHPLSKTNFMKTIRLASQFVKLVTIDLTFLSVKHQMRLVSASVIAICIYIAYMYHYCDLDAKIAAGENSETQFFSFEKTKSVGSWPLSSA